MGKVIRYILIFFSSFYALLSSDNFAIGAVYFYVLLTIIILDFAKQKTFTLFQTWNAAFIFIILSEVLITDYIEVDLLEPVQFLVLANNFVILGYFSIKFRKFKQSKHIVLTPARRWKFHLLIFLEMLYVFFTLPQTLMIFQRGRTGVSTSNTPESVIQLVTNGALEALGFLLPGLIVFYLREVRKKNTSLEPFLWSLPIFITLILGGTRFPLLFSFAGFIIVLYSGNLRKDLTFKMKIVGLVVVLFMSAQFMKNFRALGYDGSENVTSPPEATRKPVLNLIATQMSPEGIVDMTGLMFKYFESHSHTYGASTSFLLYFWVPRSVWPDKPTMLGHWLVRKYRSGFSTGHSTSFGFTGELYADFGKFSMLFIFLLGVGLKYLDSYRRFHLTLVGSYQKLFVAMLFPYVFFFVRSPVTSTINFISIIVAYRVFKFLFMKKKLHTTQTKTPTVRHRPYNLET